MNKLILTFILSALKSRTTQNMNDVVINLFVTYRKKLIISFVFFQFSLIVISISTFHMLSEITTSIISNNFPTPEFYLSLGVNIILLIIDYSIIKSIRTDVKNYRNSLFSIESNIFQPLINQFKLERTRMELP